MNNWRTAALSLTLMLSLAISVSGQEPDTVIVVNGSYEEIFDNVVAKVEEFDGWSNVSLMKLGKLAMTMGKTVGRAGGEWTSKVAKAFKRVNTVYMLDYGESAPSVRDKIETSVKGCLSPDYLILCNKAGDLVFDETYGERSADGKHVSDLVIIMYDQSIVCIKGTVLSSDVERIVRRLNKQL